jgi:hypothetical protein
VSTIISIVAPAPLTLAPGARSVFLAGSIAQGTAPDWQRTITEALAARACVVTVLNPRRAQWDASWPQSAEDPRFAEQVTWELDALDRAEVIAMYLDPATRAPVSLLELGLFARSNKLVVCCPAPFWRKGNVDIVCARYGVPRVDTRHALVDAIAARVG